MASKKNKIPEEKELPSKKAKLDKKSKEKIKPLCKTNCGRKPRTEGFCSNCYVKFMKGIYLPNGSKHPDIIAKEKKKAEVIERRQLRAEARNKKKDREILKNEFSRDLLRILQNDNPDVNTQKYCPHWDFWTCDAICYDRLFIRKHKDCESCHEHDSKFEQLSNFVKEHINDTKKSGFGTSQSTITNTGTSETSQCT